MNEPVASNEKHEENPKQPKLPKEPRSSRETSSTRHVKRIMNSFPGNKGLVPKPQSPPLLIYRVEMLSHSFHVE